MSMQEVFIEFTWISHQTIHYLAPHFIDGGPTVPLNEIYIANIYINWFTIKSKSEIWYNALITFNLKYKKRWRIQIIFIAILNEASYDYVRHSVCVCVCVCVTRTRPKKKLDYYYFFVAVYRLRVDYRKNPNINNLCAHAWVRVYLVFLSSHSIPSVLCYVYVCIQYNLFHVSISF